MMSWLTQSASSAPFLSIVSAPSTHTCHSRFLFLCMTRIFPPDLVSERKEGKTNERTERKSEKEKKKASEKHGSIRAHDPFSQLNPFSVLSPLFQWLESSLPPTPVGHYGAVDDEPVRVSRRKKKSSFLVKGLYVMPILSDSSSNGCSAIVLASSFSLPPLALHFPSSFSFPFLLVYFLLHTCTSFIGKPLTWSKRFCLALTFSSLPTISHLQQLW